MKTLKIKKLKGYIYLYIYIYKIKWSDSQFLIFFKNMVNVENIKNN